jgi:hypothetical protein
MVSGCSATTELSSFVASSTTRRFGDFFLSRIAVEKSFFPFGSAAEADGSPWLAMVDLAMRRRPQRRCARGGELLLLAR